MCAFRSSDGTRSFTNASAAKRYNDSKPAPPTPIDGVKVPGRALGDGRQPLPASAFPKPEAPRKDSLVNSKPTPQPDGNDDQDYSQAVQDHGPALRVDIHHGDDGRSTVDAQMTDGSKHHSDHSSREDAHAAARTLSGVDSGTESDDNTPSLTELM
jgi:hypothetical protein